MAHSFRGLESTMTDARHLSAPVLIHNLETEREREKQTQRQTLGMVGVI